MISKLSDLIIKEIVLIEIGFWQLCNICEKRANVTCLKNCDPVVLWSQLKVWSCTSRSPQRTNLHVNIKKLYKNEELYQDILNTYFNDKIWYCLLPQYLLKSAWFWKPMILSWGTLLLSHIYSAFFLFRHKKSESVTVRRVSQKAAL